MKIDLRRVKDLPEILKEYNWDLILHYDDKLLDVCNTIEKEKEFLKIADDFVTRAKIDSKEDKKVITLDYVLPTKDQAFLAKGINQFVTSALIDVIQIDVYTDKHEIEFSYFCNIKKKLPDWHITFGLKPESLTLTVEYEISSVKIG